MSVNKVLLAHSHSHPFLHCQQWPLHSNNSVEYLEQRWCGLHSLKYILFSPWSKKKFADLCCKALWTPFWAELRKQNSSENFNSMKCTFLNWALWAFTLNLVSHYSVMTTHTVLSIIVKCTLPTNCYGKISKKGLSEEKKNLIILKREITNRITIWISKWWRIL